MQQLAASSALVATYAEDRADTLMRTAACLAFSCFGLHLALAMVAGTSMVSLTTPMLALSAICATCGVLEWTRPTRGSAVTMMVGGAAMVLVHVVVMHAAPPTTMQMGSTMDDGGAWVSVGLVDVLMLVGVTIAGLQALVAFLARMASRGPRREWHGPGTTRK
jgi:hypothetical protein